MWIVSTTHWWVGMERLVGIAAVDVINIDFMHIEDPWETFK